MWNHIHDSLIHVFKKHPAVQAIIPRLEMQVAKGAITAGFAADVLLHEFTRSFDPAVIQGTMNDITDTHQEYSSNGEE